MIKGDITVIMPAYQAEMTLGRALESIAGQTLRPRQIIVVDDGSKDGTLRIAEQFCEQFSDIDFVLLAQKNQGAGAARNRALAEATSTYVAFLDADDEWLPKKLERSLKYLEETNLTLVAHDYVRAQAGKPDVRIDCFRHFENAHDPYIALYRRGYLATSTVVARRDRVVAAGGFDTKLQTAQDFDLWLTMLAAPESRFRLFGEALTRYHVTPGSITSHTERRLDCTLEIADRHVADIGKRGGSKIASLWFRVAAVHYEAIMAYRSLDNMARASLVLARLPGKLMRATLDAVIGAGVTPGKTMAMVFAGWIVVILSAYVFQFRHLINPILQVLGA